MNLQGKITEVMPVQTFQSGKAKYGFVLETTDKYPQFLPFEVWGDERWKNMNVTEGAAVDVSFDLNGRKYNGKCFVSLNAWKVVHLSSATQPSAPQATAAAPVQPRPQAVAESPLVSAAPATPADDGLPF